MDDLYDEFGNFIGEEAEVSEEESQQGVDAGQYVSDDYPEEAPEGAGQDLMEVDGELLPRQGA
jgi:U5 small nuclear ribonucleoprotein component